MMTASASNAAGASASRDELDSESTLLPNKPKFFQDEHPWSVRKHAGYVVGTVVALWVVCYAVSTLLIEALLRVTS